ncbi:MAG: CPBP family intramembrane metalloprotease [Ruminococcaceae bacterium]|nr:CPBP family intramembrane metalloprotease [Oscillospiraceae bacterium]
MNKLYEKSELWFAVLWIIVYVVGTSLTDSLGFSKIPTFVFHAVLCYIAFLWLRKNGMFEKYGLCKPVVPASKLLYYVPLLIPVTCNFWFGVTMNMPLVETVFYICSMICVGFLEELIFRGFLFKAMAKDNIKAAVIVSSITFGIGHIVNLINGSGAELVPNLCQVCYAIAIGFMFVMLFHYSKSLWVCIITHSIVNALSAFGVQAGMTGELISAAILTVVPAAYAVYIAKHVSVDSNVDISY